MSARVVPPPPISPGFFYKADSFSVAFTTTGSTVSLKAGTRIALPSGIVIAFAVDTAVQMPSLAAGTDYAIYLCNDGSIRADANFSAPTGFDATTSRKIGGFHYAPGSNAAAQAGGNTTPAINPYSLWDLKWCPKSADPRGMALIAGSFWSDIYLLGINHTVDGTSKNGATIADGGSPPKKPLLFGGDGSTSYGDLTWYTAAETLSAYGKRLPSCAEFAAAAYGTTENTSRGTDAVTAGIATTNAGTVADNLFTSKWGLIQAVGCMAVWGRDFNFIPAGADLTTLMTGSYKNITGSRGQVYTFGTAGLATAYLGGNWANGSDSGSRTSYWSGAPSGTSSGIGARGCCDHLQHV
jgi:hypothetical protein